jgi:hypothetical protein
MDLRLLKFQTSSENFDEVLKAREEDAKIITSIATGYNRIADVGCGLGILMSLLDNRFREIHLIDKTHYPEEVEKGFNNHSLGHTSKSPIYYITEKRLSGVGSVDNFDFYNDLEYAETLVKKGNSESIVKSYSPDNLPEGPYDIIVSTFSWGFHYPFDTYIDWALANLTDKGTIVMTLNNNYVSEVKEKYNYLTFTSLPKKFFSVASVYMAITNG